MNPENEGLAKKLYTKTNKAAESARKVTVVACVPYVYLPTLNRVSKKYAKLGVQDVSAEFSGSFTGSVSANMVRAFGAEYTIIGHSERKALGENNELIAKKLKTALESGLRVVLCVGENVRDESGAYLEEIRNQITTFFSELPKKHFFDVIITYEPVWAVGKSYDMAMKPEEIHEITLYIKKLLAEIYSRENAMSIPILYGGSVDLENAEKILSDGEVSGLLIGRQSLDPENFSKIIAYANRL